MKITLPPFMLTDLKAVGVLPLWWCDFSFWEARNVKGGVELMGLDMLILDSKGGPISKLIIILGFGQHLYSYQQYINPF
ncbi:unnamed protein product [Brassica oleracea var. botrytis]